MSEGPEWLALVDTSAASDWVRCALQVNPFSYVERHGVDKTFADAASYDAAVADALAAAEVRLVSVADHFRIHESESLLRAVRERGIAGLPGFEANTSEGVHLLVVFEEDTPLEEVRDAIKACDLHDADAASPISRLSATQLMAAMHEAGGICLAAHATMDSGVLKTLGGSARVQAGRLRT